MQHLSARIAWHDNGWNGHLCKEPGKNIYCSGRYSFPGDMIGEYKDTPLEEENKCKGCNNLEFIPPCCYSINAFGKEEIECFVAPPDFFRDDTETKYWKLPTASICTWPYEEMYKDEVKINGRYYDPKKRSKAMEEYYSQFERDKSLIFYYVNYDNPFCGEEKKYVLVGVSKVKEILPTLKWENQGDESYEKYGDMVWARVIQSHYPDEGFRIPYENYMDNEEVLSKLVFTPENPRSFKYATRAFNDDEALELVERLVEIVGYLIEIGNKTEDWNIRLNWLSSIMGELWQNRGVYTGISGVLDYLGGSRVIPLIKKELDNGTSEEVIYDEVRKLLNGDSSSKFNGELDSEYVKRLQKQWKYKEDVEQEMLINVFPRFAITAEQIRKILDEDRANNGIYSSLQEIIENPYIICEEYIGDEPDDIISFPKIDHGVFPPQNRSWCVPNPGFWCGGSYGH